MTSTNGTSLRGDRLEKIKRQLASGSGRNLLQGPLLKRSETLRKWNERWVILDPTTGKMEYKTRRNDPAAEGTILFDADSTIAISPVNFHGLPKYDGCCFYIGTPQKKDYFLCAETPGAARAWVSTLQLAIHIQHLSNTSTLLQNKIQESPLLCASSDQVVNNQFVEPIRSRQFSHVCTAPVKYDQAWNSEPGKDVAYIVTGAQLLVKKLDSGKNVLHLRLLYSGVVDSYVVQSSWGQSSDGMSQRRTSGLLSAISMSLTGTAFGLDKRVDEGNGRGSVDGGGPVVIDSAVFPGGPPASSHGQKLLRFVDVGEVCRGPQDSPGHWLVTGARLELEKGKICLLVKFSLLNFS